jgi:hypothetical protein
MRILKNMPAAVGLMCVLSLSAFAGETMTPPCSPGQIETPPCAMAQAPTPGDIDMPAITQIATFVLQNMWSLF